MNDKRTVLQHWPVMVLAAVVVGIFLAGLVTFQVRETEIALVMRLGKAREGADGKVIVYGAGLHRKLPFFDEVWRTDKRLQTYELKKGRTEQITTSDNHQIVVSTYVLWKVADPALFFKSFPPPDSDFTSELDALVRSARNNVLPQHALAELVNVDPSKARLGDIEAEILAEAQPRAREQYGIDIVSVGFKHIGFPEQVTQKVFARMRAEREKRSQEYLSQGLREAQRIRAEADREASDTVARAQAESKRIRAEGDEQAAKSYAVFQQSPELAAFLRKLDALRLTLSEKTTLVVDTNTPPYDLFLKGATDIDPGGRAAAGRAAGTAKP
ncbi:MAG: protease modulator HflC [Lentisphaerae bacterium]|nr:protease modulator HflC [Lentisphaerota bacterium]